MEEIISALTDTDDKKAYARTRAIAAASEESSAYYPYLETFAALLDHPKSYIRTRAFILCCCQARWDDSGRLAQILPRLTRLLHDEKPTVVRQCLNGIKEIIVFRPELCPQICEEIARIELSNYKETMRRLIQRDMAQVLSLMAECTGQAADGAAFHDRGE